MSLQRYPFLRLLLPLALGIWLGDTVPRPFPLWDGAIALLLWFFLVIRSNRRSWSFGVTVFLFFFGLGYGLMSERQMQTRFPFKGEAAVYRIRLCTPPEEKPNSFQLQALLLAEVRSDTLIPYHSNPLFCLYLPKSLAADSLQRGDELLLRARLSPITNNGNPDEFDYVDYMEHKGFSGWAYVRDGYWRKSGHDPRRTLQEVAQDYREQVVNLYRRLAIDGDELAVLSALTVGEKSRLSSEIREMYATTGSSHVLALSGMHVALVYGLFVFLLTPLWRRFPRLKPFLIFLLVCLLDCFAFFTGLSPSVVRSVLMFSLFACIYPESKSFLKLNVLTATAFFMLLFKPAWLFDVSFQLSFLAILAITYVHPKLYALWRVKNRVLRFFWNLVSLSLSVQLCSAPLLMCYFSRFTFHFLLSNLWIVVTVSLIIYVALLLLLLTPLPALQLFLAPALKWLIAGQNFLLRTIEQLPGATVEGIWLDGWGVLFAFLFIGAAYYALTRPTARNCRLALYALFCLAAWHTHTMIADAPHMGVAFYNVRGCTAVHCLTRGSSSWIVCPDSAQKLSYLRRALAPHWNRLRLQPPRTLIGTRSAPGIAVQDQILTYAGRRICFLTDDRWRKRQAPQPLAVDFLYISRGYRGGIEELAPLFSIGTVVTDSSLSLYRQEKISSECARLGIPCHNLARQGALQVQF